MLVSGRIELRLPGKENVYFDLDNSVGDIFNYISENLNLNTAGDVAFIDIDVCDLKVEDDNQTAEIAESVVDNGKGNIDLIYDVPKNLAFTQRFQDRIKHEIPNIIESVYDDCKVVGIYWLDQENTMKLTISVEFSNENHEKYSKYLDENVGYAIDDMISYYSK